MNIFFIEPMSNIPLMAQSHVDKHVISGIKEGCQMLLNPIRIAAKEGKLSHPNHPMSKWVRATAGNWKWTYSYVKHLQEEWRYRRQHPEYVVHGSFCQLQIELKFLKQDSVQFCDTPCIEITTPPQCFGDWQWECENCVYMEGYRKYYNLAKRHLFTWTRRDIPKWIIQSQELVSR